MNVARFDRQQRLLHRFTTITITIAIAREKKERKSLKFVGKIAFGHGTDGWMRPTERFWPECPDFVQVAAILPLKLSNNTFDFVSKFKIEIEIEIKLKQIQIIINLIIIKLNLLNFL